MSDKQPMQAMGKSEAAAPDGVNDTPAKSGGGSESSGGAYPNPHTGKKGDNSGIMGHGGQTEIAYSGTGGRGDDADNANAVASDKQ